ncbi:MAG: type III-B CRISPR module RAMP protein Cmr6 [Hydrogenobaculum sp.]
MINGKYGKHNQHGKDNYQRHKDSRQEQNQDAILVIPKGHEIKLSLKTSNPKLLLEKYIPFYNPKTHKTFEINDAKTNVYELLKERNFQDVDFYITKLNRRQKEVSDINFTLVTKSRLIVGLGSGSVLEVSIKLHFIYGFPYIPSSAIKGVLRAYKILEKVGFDLEKYGDFEKKIEKGEQIEEEHSAFVEIFGNQEKIGSLIVLDALPDKFPALEEDIMNPHYPDYYSKKAPPTDNQHPNPIKFITVPKGTKFNFYFKNHKTYENIFKSSLKDDLVKAFEFLGIGSKTGLGYGVIGD